MKKPKSDTGILLRDRLKFIASQAPQAAKLNLDEENLPDLIDEIDKDLQAAIDIINCARGADDAKGLRTYLVSTTFKVDEHADEHLQSERAISDEITKLARKPARNGYER